MTRSRQCALIGHRANPPLRDPDAGKKCPTPRTENVFFCEGAVAFGGRGTMGPHERKAYQRQPNSQCMQRPMPVVSSLSYRPLSIRYRTAC
ncbi:hypothetical protein DENSPDRAFT_839916 [Dentipellis sp. KUC8613]|nr:hypothetical protein DENSPDRAFT_839916 [Dentipellis sp. KUC8613]